MKTIKQQAEAALLKHNLSGELINEWENFTCLETDSPEEPKALADILNSVVNYCKAKGYNYMEIMENGRKKQEK